MTGYTPAGVRHIGVKTVTAGEQHEGDREADRVSLDERQAVARGIIRRMLVQFHREWTDLVERERGGARALAANALLDRYSHQLYDVACDVEAILGSDLAVEIRCLSADMIKTTNILIMIGCGEECREKSDVLAKEACRGAERCLMLVQTRGNGPAARVLAAHREE